MPTFFVNSFGAYSFGNNLAKITTTANWRDRTAERPNRGGKFSAGPIFSSLSCVLDGVLTGASSSPQDMRDAIDALAAAFALGKSAQLKIDDDRYLNVEVRSFGYAEGWKGLPYLPWTASLESYDDPPIWDVASTSVSSLLTDGSANNFTCAGSGTAQPIITIAFSAAPSGSTCTITDQLGNQFVISPDAATTFVVDSTQETVTVGGVDKSSVCTGVFPLCPAGANDLTIVLSGGATVSSASLSYQARRY
jgi:hypothetical protein